MFWYIMISGLKVLTYWETYAAVLEYLAIFFILYYITGAMMRKGKGKRVITGQFFLLIIPLLQAVAMTLFILTLAPVMFGIAGDAAWSFPWETLVTAPGLFFTQIGILTAAAGIMAIIPLLRRLAALQTFVLGVIALLFAFGIFITENPGIIKGPVTFLPDSWFFIGLLVIVSVMSWVGKLAAAFAGKAFDIAEDVPGRIMLFPLASIFGFIPLFMYGALLGIQIKAGF